MLVSPPYHEISASHDSLQSTDRKKSSESLKQSCSKTFRNSCSTLSVSSAPPSSFDSFTSPKKNLSYGFKECERTSLSPSKESRLALEPTLYEEQTTVSVPIRATSCPNTFFYLETNKYSPNCSNAEEREDVFNKDTASNNITQSIHQQRSAHSQSSTSHPKPHDSLSSQSTSSRKTFNNITDKEMRKKLKNRESAQAARDRKKAKMLSLETQIKDLLQQNQILEADNLELRTQLHKVMVERGYWKNENQNVDSFAGDAPALHTYPVGLSAAEPQNTYSTEKTTSFDRTDGYQHVSNLNEYTALSQPIVTAEENNNNEEANLTNFDQSKLDSNTFHTPSPYGQPLWSSDALPAVPGSQSSVSYSVGSINYDEPNIL